MANIPNTGDFVKIFLPGEAPWAECISVNNDGSWYARIDNRLVGEMNDGERAALSKELFGEELPPLKKLHNFCQGQVVRVALLDDVWQPTLEQPSRH